MYKSAENSTVTEEGKKRKGKRERKNKRGKKKGKRNPCYRKYKDYCFHGECRYLHHINEVACRYLPFHRTDIECINKMLIMCGQSVPVRVAKPGTTGPCDFYQYLCTGHALDKADTFTVPEQTKKRITIWNVNNPSLVAFALLLSNQRESCLFRKSAHTPWSLDFWKWRYHLQPKTKATNESCTLQNQISEKWRERKTFHRLWNETGCWIISCL